MAKVIRRGTKHEEAQKAEYTCSKCDSLVEFHRSDIRSDQRDGSYVVCPVCGGFITTKVVFK